MSSVNRIRFGMTMAVVVGLAACEAPTKPLPVPTPTPVPTATPTPVPSPVPLIPVSVSGLVIDADSNAKLPGAIVTLATVGTPNQIIGPDPPVRATADESGSFRLTENIPADWVGIGLDIAREGYERQNSNLWSVMPSTVNNIITVATYPILTLRAGETLSTRVHLDHYVCADEYLCRRIVVDASPSEPLDLELTPISGSQKAGLITTPGLFLGTSFPRQMTLTKGEVWIATDRDTQVTIRATRR
jgi:hypothetical protein